MEHEDVPLLLIAGAKGAPLDPVRVQYGVFLLQEKIILPRHLRHDFNPCHFGPYSNSLRGALDALEDGGLIMDVSQGRYAEYALSPKGANKATGLVEDAGREFLDYLSSLREWLLDRKFSELLRVIFRDYPRYAVNVVLPYPGASR